MGEAIPSTKSNKITSEHRATIYCMMLAEIDNQLFNDEEWGSLRYSLCNMMRYIFDKDMYNQFYFIVETEFP